MLRHGRHSFPWQMPLVKGKNRLSAVPTAKNTVVFVLPCNYTQFPPRVGFVTAQFLFKSANSTLFAFSLSEMHFFKQRVFALFCYFG